MAVILTTPYMDEAVRCNRLGFMRAGRIIAEGTPSQLRSRLDGRIIEVHTDSPIKMIEKVQQIAGVEDVRAFGEKLHLRTSADKAGAILRVLKDQSALRSAKVISPTLEDVFISLSMTAQVQEAPRD